ncbi:hypothetical protein BDN70DRAFT_706006 [Pholiota conissans]|uniref:Uncharacterized protein n=1 Tax=Pholiota conissans TaxID=109636 RepID=A0A9P6D6U6_9AGAR|nr:hypothetical protein BDN70DRAFT_706006 [Pholiota conissans]
MRRTTPLRRTYGLSRKYETLSSKDVVACAPAGAGKTLLFWMHFINPTNVCFVCRFGFEKHPEERGNVLCYGACSGLDFIHRMCQNCKEEVFERDFMNI